MDSPPDESLREQDLQLGLPIVRASRLVACDGAAYAAPSIKSSKLYFIHGAVRVTFLLWLGEAFWVSSSLFEVPDFVDPCEAVL